MSWTTVRISDKFIVVDTPLSSEGRLPEDVKDLGRVGPISISCPTQFQSGASWVDLRGLGDNF